MSNIEIERKWLIKQIPSYIINNIDRYKKKEITQAYISFLPHIRIRFDGKKYFINFKNVIEKEDIMREEYEHEISKEEYDNLSNKIEGIVLTKTRYYIPIENYLNIELDVFHNDYEGLIYAEIEFKNKNDALKFVKKDWFYKELTGIKEYTNAGLSQKLVDINNI